jgi:hypothetical protein
MGIYKQFMLLATNPVPEIAVLMLNELSSRRAGIVSAALILM